MELDTQHFKELLEAERDTLETELSSISKKNPANSADWQAVSSETDKDRADETEVADALEQYDADSAVVAQLEARMAEVKHALEKIDDDTYGICEECEAPIEEDRMEANPAAVTCKAHMN